MDEFLRIFGTVVVFAVPCGAAGVVPVLLLVPLSLGMLAVAAHQLRANGRAAA